MATHSNTQTSAISSAFPSFVSPATELENGVRLAIRYWRPERTGDVELDYQRGKQHFREAVEVSFRPEASNFLSHVIVAMFGTVGPMETGFIDALLEVAPYGSQPPRLTDEEIATASGSPEDGQQLRALETQMADAIAARKWLPDLMRFELLWLLNGKGGDLIGAAVTMLARLALNGLRN